MGRFAGRDQARRPRSIYRSFLTVTSLCAFMWSMRSPRSMASLCRSTARRSRTASSRSTTGHFSSKRKSSTQATIDLPIVFDRDLALRIHVVYAISKIDGVTLSIHGQAISHRVEPLDDGTFLIHAQIKHALARCTRDFGITLDRAETSRPIDLGRSEDPRWLGIAVNWIELSPLPERGA